MMRSPRAKLGALGSVAIPVAPWQLAQWVR